jgi:hypothetical protein
MAGLTESWARAGIHGRDSRRDIPMKDRSVGRQCSQNRLSLNGSACLPARNSTSSTQGHVSIWKVKLRSGGKFG